MEYFKDLYSRVYVQIFKDQRKSAYLSMVASIPVMAIFYEKEYSWTWYVCVMSTLILRVMASSYFMKKTADDKNEKLYSLLLFINGLAWGMSIPLFYNGESVEGIFIHIYMIAIVAGGMQKTRASMLCSKAFIVGILGPFVITNLINIGVDRVNGVNALAGAVFVLYMWMAAKDNYKDFIGRMKYTIQEKREKDTLKKQLEVEEELKTQRAISLNASKMVALGELAGNVAHEINNPLAIIGGKVMLLKKIIPKENKKVLKHIDDIDTTVKRISKIISGLKKFSYGKDMEEMENFTIESLMDDVFSLLGDRLRIKSINVAYNWDSSLEIHANKTASSQVVVNLINNAIHAMEEVDDKTIFLETRDSSDYVYFLIKDSGEGISDENVDKIFKSYFTTKEKGKGTGLGLSISKRIMQDMDGDLTLESYKPATFLITFPKKVESSK